MSEDAERIFEQALALEVEAQRAFVVDACRGDLQLRDELLSLLAQAPGAEQFFVGLTDAVFAASFSRGMVAPSSAESELHVGDDIGQYRILSLIGSGGMGTVYRAHDTRLDRDVALKFLPSSLSAQPNAEERLLMEARAAAALEHPNVCSIHEIGETADGRRFIAMACYEGETLKERLRRGPLSLEEAVATAVQIARGLGAAHARGIVHRDVKPGNVMLGSDGVARLLDFGLATMTDATLARPGITPGTIAYMSPEQARGDALDQRTDLWSLGVVLYEMLAGTRPFQGPAAGALLWAIKHQDVEPIAKRRPDVPAVLARIVERLLRKDPATRYRDAAEVLADLDAALPSGHGASQPRAVTGRRAVLLAGSTILLVTLAVALVWSRGGGERSLAGLIAARAEPSIAVLPLANLSGDSSDGGLAAGMTEALIATLAKAGDLRVISSTSSSRFGDREMDVRRVADSLGVSNILEGGVQKIGSQLRVHVRLVAGRDGATRWSQAYARDFNDVFAVQDEIVQAVAGELELRFDKDRLFRRHQTRNIAAYELFLRGSDPLLQRSVSGVWKALQYFQQAIAADSTYAAAYAELSAWQVRRGATSDPGMPLRDLFALAEGSARKAVALDDSLAEAHFSVGRALGALLKFREAEQEIRRAIALDPNRSLYRFGLANLNVWYGRSEEELAEARAALETDPLNPFAIVAVARGLFSVGRYDEALAQLDRVAAMQPPMRAVAFVTAQCYAKQGRLPEAIAALRPHAESGDPMFRGMLGHMLARAGQRDEANRVLADLRTRWERTGVGAFQIAIVHAGLGDIDQAFAWLDKSIDDLSIGSAYVGSDIMGPTFEDLHRDPRFQRFRSRLGLQG